MKQPTREKINEWINTTERLRSRKQKLFNDGYMQLNNLSIEGVFYSFSLYDKHDAICFALLEDKAQALESLNRSVTNGMIPYQMAFDDNCEFHEIARSPEDNGFIHLPIAHQQALTMAALNNDVLNQSLLPFLLLLEKDLNDGDSMEMVQTVEALRNILAHGDDAKSEALLKVALDHSKTHPIQGGWRRRTYTINLSLWAILRRDQHTFDEALALNLKDYEQAAKGEVRGTPEAYVSLAAVGLVKLARRYGLKYDGDNPLIPAALL